MLLKKLVIVIVVGVLFLVTTTCFAGCEHASFSQWRSKFNLPKPINEDASNFSDCKVLNENPNHMLIATLTSSKKTEDSEELDLNLLVIELLSGKPIAREFFKKRYESDAVVITDIMIESTAYPLIKDKKIFGIRVGSRNSSRVNQYYNKVLSLFVIEGTQIRSILKDTQIAGDWMEENGECSNSDKLTADLSILAQQSNGFFDIEKAITKKSSTEVEKNGKCIETVVPAVNTKSILKYDGKMYNE